MSEWVIALVSAFAVFGNILNVKRIQICFLIWLLCNIFWLTLDLYQHSYSRSILDVINIFTSSWGTISWIKHTLDRKKNEKTNLNQ